MNVSQVMFVVAICTSVIAGAVTAIATYRSDITNIAIPATEPTIFSDFIPREATHIKKTNSTSVNPCNATTEYSLISEPRSEERRVGKEASSRSARHAEQ